MFLVSSVFGQNDWEQLADSADMLRRSGSFEASIKMYTRLFEKLPKGNNDLRNKYGIRFGLSYFLLGDNTGATHHFENVIVNTNADTLNIYRAHALNNLGLVYDNTGRFLKSIALYQRAGELYEQLGENSQCDKTRMNIAKVLHKQGNYSESLKLLTKVLRSFEIRGDSSQIGESYSTMGLIQEALGDFGKAKLFHRRAIGIWKATNDDYGLASSYNNIGWVYKQSGQSDSSLSYYHRAISLMKKVGLRNLGHCYHNVAGLYSDRGIYSKARTYYFKALKHKEELSDSSEVIISANALIKLENKLHNWSAARKYLNRYSPYLTERSSKLGLRDHFFEWKNYYQGVRKLDSAVFYWERYYRLEQDVLNETYLRELARLQESYEADKRERDIIYLGGENVKNENTIFEKEQRIQQLLWLVVASMIAIIALVFVILYFRQRSRKKQLESKMRGIEDEKKRVSMELHDASGANLKKLAMEISFMIEQSKGTIQEQLESLRKKTETTLKEIVMISHTLHHPRIESTVFASLIEDYIYDWLEGTDYNYREDTRDITVLNSFVIDSKSHIYRFIQETLINIDKHSTADDILFSVERKGDYIKLSISDNGLKQGQTEKKGIGHKNLRERAKIMGGTFEFVYTENGSMSTLNIPISKNTI